MNALPIPVLPLARYQLRFTALTEVRLRDAMSANTPPNPVSSIRPARVSANAINCRGGRSRCEWDGWSNSLKTWKRFLM